MASEPLVKVHVPEGQRVRFNKQLVKGPTTLQMLAKDAAPLLAKGTVLDEESHQELKRIRAAEKKAERERVEAQRQAEKDREAFRRKAAERNRAFNEERASSAARRQARLDAADPDTVEVDLVEEDDASKEEGEEVELHSFKTKADLATFAKERFGVDLDTNKNREQLDEEVGKLLDAE